MIKAKATRKPSKAYSPPSIKQGVDLAITFLEDLDCARSLSIAILLRYDHLSEVSLLPFDHKWFEDPQEHALWWQAHRLLAKADFFDASPLAADASLEKFFEAEATCKAFNHRLRSKPLRGRAGDILHIARGKISYLLGDVTRLIPEIMSMSRWGGGSSSSVSGEMFTERYNKVSSYFDVTTRLVPYEKALREELPFAPVRELRVRPGNVVTTVPKNIRTDRTIAVEPTVNALLQRGVGMVLRRKLRRWGVDLTSQTMNQDLAKLGSVDGSFATIDLSAASDTISRGIVEFLLPREWVSFLELLRSESYRVPKGIGSLKQEVLGVYHKHSSMGNGYTFELETLIFASIVLATRDYCNSYKEFAVYGDDIVVSTDIAPYVVGCLRTAGFSTNHEKSFLRGPFRESCGEEFFRGTRCTPVYLRGIRSDSYSASIINFANWLRSEASWAVVDIRRSWLKCVTLLPKHLRLFGPPEVDGVLHCNVWEVTPSFTFVCSAAKSCLAYKIKRLHFIPYSLEIENQDGMNAPWYVECLLRLGESTPFPELSLLGLDLTAPISRVNTARRRGRWVTGSTVVIQWGTVRA